MMYSLFRNNSKQGSEITRLVCALIVIGFGSCVVTMALAKRTVSGVQADRSRTENTHTVLGTAMANLRITREAIAQELRDWREKSTVSSARDTGSLDQIITRCKSQLAQLDAADPDILAALESHRQSLIELKNSVSRFGRLKQEVDRVEVSRTEAIDAARKSVREAVAAIEKIEGMQRLHRSVLVRRYRKAVVADKSTLSAVIIKDFECSQHINTLKPELIDFALLIERLIAIQNFDDLVNLKDNQLRQTLARMFREARATEAELKPILKTHAHHLQEAILGQGVRDDADHQTIIVGQGGLYRRQHEYLRSSQKLHSIEADLLADFSRCMDSERRVSIAITNLTSLSATRGVQDLHNAWRSALTVAIVAITVFCILGGGIARMGRRAEVNLLDALKESDDGRIQLRTIMETASEGIVTIDTRGIVRSFNLAAVKMFGYRAEEVIGQNVSMLMTSPEAEEHDEYLNRYLRTGQTNIIGNKRSAEGKRKDGTLFPMELAVSEVNLESTRLFTAIIRDLTERRQSESELASLNRQLVDLARQAGKAEVATSVLHNVGNVLNSVNVSAGLIQDKVRESGVFNLTKAVDVMEEHLGDLPTYVSQDDRGKHLPRFLIDVSRQIAGEEEMILAEINSLISNIDHIKAVVATQQADAKSVSGVVEEVSLADLLEDAIQIDAVSIVRRSITISRQFDDVGPILADKQKILQIMVNLISNAKYACVESGNEDHQLTISLRRTGKDYVSLEVRDNGMGIAAENMTRIFAHGFTTRKEGHGFGLHSAALAAKELDGSLTATSEGPGTGATFTLKIPYQQVRIVLEKA